MNFPGLSYIWGETCIVEEYDGKIHVYDTYSARNHEMYSLSDCPADMPASMCRQVELMQEAVKWNSDTIKLTYLWRQEEISKYRIQDIHDLKNLQLPGRPSLKIIKSGELIAIEIDLSPISIIPTKRMEALKTTTRIVDKRQVDLSKDYFEYSAGLVWLVAGILFRFTSTDEIKVTAYTSENKNREIPDIALHLTRKKHQFVFDRRVITLEKINKLSKIEIRANADYSFCETQKPSSTSMDQKAKHVRIKPRISIFDEIVYECELAGGLNLAQIVRLSKGTEESCHLVPLKANWFIYFTGEPLERLKRYLIDRGFDSSDINKVKDAEYYERSLSSDYFKQIDYGDNSKQYQSIRDKIVKGRHWDDVYTWNITGASHNEVFKQAGFDFDVCPALEWECLDHVTGELTFNRRTYYASGKTYDKIVRDFKPLEPYLALAKKIDKGVTLFTRGIIIGMDPILEELPQIGNYRPKMIELAPCHFTDEQDAYERSPEALTQRGKTRKRLLDAKFDTTTEKGTSIQKWIINYSGSGSVLGFGVFAINSRSCWNAYFERSSDKKGYKLTELTTDTRKRANSHNTKVDYNL